MPVNPQSQYSPETLERRQTMRVLSGRIVFALELTHPGAPRLDCAEAIDADPQNYPEVEDYDFYRSTHNWYQAFRHWIKVNGEPRPSSEVYEDLRELLRLEEVDAKEWREREPDALQAFRALFPDAADRFPDSDRDLDSDRDRGSDRPVKQARA